MGIKGIYNEIGPGRRVALSKLAVEHYERHGRPLRLAIDISIWLFQIQSSKGGTNPALRTFYYRLLRLISLSIHPLFVFDGPNKPPFKRHKRTGPNVASIPEFLAKQLLKQFGLPSHLAPGEAEAECALLQRKGVVDAVLSEDVDTLMFGSGLTFRSWSPEPTVKTKSPTHVNVYDARETKSKAGLDRQGMILVAMMSGGDYIPEGVPGIGQKTACEAARARFGEDLCRIKKNDKKAIAEWKERLIHELKTNESKLFKQKHKTLEIPEDFPRMDVLGYYTDPVVSSDDKIQRLQNTLRWDQDFDIPGLRTFCAEAFGWVCIGGAKHFIRNLSRALLVRSLRMRADESTSDDPYEVATQEAKLVKTIHGRRQHMSTDNTDELRVGFRPLDVVPLDLDAEEPDPELPIEGIESDDDAAAAAEDIGDVADEPSSPRKTRKAAPYDPAGMVKDWVFETYVKVGVPLKMQDWEETFRNAKKYEAMKVQRKRTEKETRARKGGVRTQSENLDIFTKVTKPGARVSKSKSPSLLPDPQAIVLPRLDEMEPIPLKKPAQNCQSRLNLTASNTLQCSQSTFRPPPSIPPTSPASEKDAATAVTVNLLSSPSSSQAQALTSRPFRRADTEPFAVSEQLDNTGADKPAANSCDMAIVQSTVTQSNQKNESVQSCRRLFRRTKSIPEAATDASYESLLANQTEVTLCGRRVANEGISPPPDSQRESQSSFKKPQGLPPSPKKLDPNRNLRPGSASEVVFASPSKVIAILSSPSSSASRMIQTAMTQFFPSSPPASPSPVRTRRERELSPFYANNGPEYDYSDMPALRMPTKGAEAESTCQNATWNEEIGLSREVEHAVSAHRRSPRQRSKATAWRKTLQETDGNKREKAAWKAREERKRILRLRESLRGSFAFDENAEDTTPKPSRGSARKGRRWQISEVEIMDLTS